LGYSKYTKPLRSGLVVIKNFLQKEKGRTRGLSEGVLPK
jgi:hypothetical protein